MTWNDYKTIPYGDWYTIRQASWRPFHLELARAQKGDDWHRGMMDKRAWSLFVGHSVQCQDFVIHVETPWFSFTFHRSGRYKVIHLPTWRFSRR